MGILIASCGILADNDLKYLSHYQIHCGVDHIEIWGEGGKKQVAEFHVEKHGEFASVPLQKKTHRWFWQGQHVPKS